MSREYKGWRTFLKELLSEEHVFDYINNNTSLSFSQFTKYLWDHNLLLEERFIYYWAAKCGNFPDFLYIELSQIKEFVQDEKEIKAEIKKEINSLENCFFNWWNEQTGVDKQIKKFVQEFKYIRKLKEAYTEDEGNYSNGKDGFSPVIFEKFSEQAKLIIYETGAFSIDWGEPIENIVQKAFIVQAGEFVDLCQENQRLQDEIVAQRMMEEESSMISINDYGLCQSCLNSPCICSDPEKTSTTWAF